MVTPASNRTVLYPLYAISGLKPDVQNPMISQKIGNILISSNLIEIWSEMTGWGDDWLFAFEHHNVLLNKSAWTS